MEEFQVIPNNLIMMKSNLQNIEIKKVKKSPLHIPKLELIALILSVLF